MTEFKYFTNVSISNDLWHTDYLLFGLTNLEKVDLPDHITNIPSVVRGNNNLGFKGILSECPNLVNVHYPNNVTNISFGETPSILDLRNTKIWGFSDSGNSKVTEIYLPSTMTNLGSRAFFDCNNLKKVVVSEG